MIKAVVILLIILNATGCIFGGFVVGRKREPLTPAAYVYSATAGFLTIYLLWRAYL